MKSVIYQSLALVCTDHRIDALREGEELDESRDQVESQQSRAQSSGASCGREMENDL